MSSPINEEKKSEAKTANIDTRKAIEYMGKTNDIKLELKRIKAEYGNKYCELYSRVMPNISNNIDIKDTLSFMQFNMLADGLSGYHSQSNKGKAFIKTPIACLNFEYRGYRIIEEIIRNKPDIITIQECDQYKFIEYYLKKYGYNGVFKPKNDSKCPIIGKNIKKYKLQADGIAIFYDKNKCKINKIYKYNKSDDINNKHDLNAIAMDITFNKKYRFIVSSFHLKSAKDANGEIIRLEQLGYILPKLCELSKDMDGIFIGCDLNSPPKHNKFKALCYESIIKGKHCIQKIKDNDKDYKMIPNGYVSGYGLNLNSAYKMGTFKGKKQGNEAEFTTYKARSKGIDKHTIDYIFYNNNPSKCIIDVIGLLSIPNIKEINNKTLLPGWEYPSDHFSIQARFLFKPKL